MPKFNDGSVREAAGWLLSLGFEYTGQSGQNHPTFRHPAHGRISLPLTPSDRRWQGAFLTRLARRMGTSKGGVELRLGLRERKRQGPRPRRERNEAGRRARTFSVVRDQGQHTERGGSLTERLQEVAEEIRADTQRLNIAVGAEYERLRSSLARLRQEYLQLEADLRGAA